MTETTSTRYQPPTDLTKFAWLSIAAAIVTIALKGVAAWITGSVGLLSDAMESVVNLVAAIVALIALKVSIKSPDRSHNFGHSKAEYFSAGAEGMMIFVAAVGIIYTAIERIIHPAPPENLGIGLLISVAASLVNGGVALVLLRAAKQYNSLTLHADGKHLMTDVVTSVGVLVGVGLVLITGWGILDPLVALAVGVNIVWTGIKLLRDAGAGLMDSSLTRPENDRLVALLQTHMQPGTVEFHGLRTRVAGQQKFAEVHLLVPGSWSVQRGHDMCEQVEVAVHQEMGIALICHLEPIEDPKSYEDVAPGQIPVQLPDEAVDSAG